tara:strand:- start:4733 stop:5830 length:1098 start_codon:yes stop_codon:yes gene_type:complete
MSQDNPFLYKGLTPSDEIAFAKAFQIAFQVLGKDSCWCLKKNTNSFFKGFKTSNIRKLLYKNTDARPLILAMAGKFPDEEKTCIVRRSICTSNHCLNPTHYYWGTRSGVAYENAKRKGITADLITKLRLEKKEGASSLQLSKAYNLPYQTVRRICTNITYEDVTDTNNSDNLKKEWEKVLLTCEKLVIKYPNEAKNFNLDYHMTNELECPWGHKGNFGLMGECLDCMEEIKNGRCTVDVTNFDFRTWYWQVKRFWDQVNIEGPTDCWKWQGATRKHGTESTAHFPGSPFHSAKTQSASRVAFWTSRGYTGKYRIFCKPTCESFCCNPTHLTIKELKNHEQPNEVERIRLTHENIFKQKKSNSEKK